MRPRSALGCVAALCASALVVAGGSRSEASPTTLSAVASASDAQRSPTGLIAFSLGPYPHQDIYVVRADGSGLTRLTTDQSADFDPSWSPDGRRIAYRHQRGDADDTSEIYVMNADGSRPRNLTRRQGQDHSPAWSPDGKSIAFASVRNGTLGIWVMGADGSRQRRLSHVDGEYPAWSPDGKKIAFDRNRPGRTGWDIWTMNADGSKARPLVASPGQDQGAAWSPDGTTIAFQSDRGSGGKLNHLWLVKANGFGQRRLTAGPGERPSWSPDGAHIAYTAGGLFLVRRNGLGTTNIGVRVPGEAALSDWNS